MMGRWAASSRLQFENEFREEPDGSFMVRPFGAFGRPYILADRAARDRYISKRIVLSRLRLFAALFVSALMIICLFFPDIFEISPSTIIYYVGILIVIQNSSETVLAWRLLRKVGGRPVPRARWHRARRSVSLDSLQDPFAATDSGLLGGIFILLVALTVLLAAILLASYFGPPGRDAGMPYILFLLGIMVTGSLAVAIWRELWLRERHNSSL